MIATTAARVCTIYILLLTDFVVLVNIFSCLFCHRPAALREVCAHAVLGSHQHLVRYYSAWAEDNHMLIQNEFCDGERLQHCAWNQIMDQHLFDGRINSC